MTTWSWVNKDYRLTMEITLSNDSGYYKKYTHTKKFKKNNNNQVTVFSRSWRDEICGAYDVSVSIKLYDKCKQIEDSRYRKMPLNCSCYECDSAGDCGDGNPCNGVENCVNHQCVAGTPLDCDDGNTCTSDYCDPITGCYYSDTISGCNDGDACTENDRCSQWKLRGRSHRL